MSVDRWGDQISAVRQQIETLERYRQFEREGSDDPLAMALEELRVTLEELQVAQEELTEQNRQLQASQRDLENERRRYQDLFEFAPDGYLVTDAEGTIREANVAAAGLLNVPRRFLAGKPLITFVRSAERRAFRARLNRIGHGDSLQEWVVSIEPRGRQVFPAAITVLQTEGPREQSLRWLVRDITERIQAEEEIRTLNENIERRVQERTEELERASAAKDEFLGLVSHELKTPITTILGNAEVLRSRASALDEESRQLALADIEEEADRLHRIIENMLVLARLETADHFDTEPVLVQHIARTAAEDHRRRYPWRQVEIAPGPVPPATAQPTYVEQLLRNLLRNAEKYSPPDTPIEIEFAERDGQLVTSVLDRGPGVLSEESELIFLPFYRSRRTSGDASGAGIGLAVCRLLVEALGGRIGVQRRDGGGSRFTFSLPLCLEESPLPEIAHE